MLDFVCRAEHALDFVSDDVINELTAVFEVLPRVEVIWMGSQMLADAGCQAQAQVRVDVDFADGHGSSFTELVFRNTDSVGQIAAVFVDDFDVFRNDRRSAVQDDRESREPFGNFFQNIEAKCRRYENALFVARALSRREFVCAVAGADSDS